MEKTKYNFILQIGASSEVVAVIMANTKKEFKAKVIEAIKDVENLVDAEITQNLLEDHQFQIKCIEKHNDYEITGFIQEVTVY